MYFPILINWTSPFPIFGVLGGIFHFSSKKTLLLANSGEPDQTSRFAASDLVFHCLPMSQKMDTRVIWVNFWHTVKTGMVPMGMVVTPIFEFGHFPHTVQSLFNTPHYNTDL